MDVIFQVLEEIEEVVEAPFQGVARWKILTSTVILTYTILYVRNFLSEVDDLKEYLKERTFYYLKKFPHVKRKIEAEFKEARIAIEKELIKDEEKKLLTVTRLPKSGKSAQNVLSLTAEALKIGEFDWKDGKVSGGMFAGRDENYTKFMTKIYEMTSWTNPLHSDLFPGIRKMEAEVIRMTANLFHGDENVVGSMTTGGSDSLILMMKAYREWAKVTRGIHKPEVIVTRTVHAAIGKGAEILGFRIKEIPFDPKTMTMKLSSISGAITANTAMIVVSAPDFAYGAMDDIQGAGAIAMRKGIPVHVDCCLGGFIFPFMEKAGFPLPPFDFRVPGVTSISADTHKYGMAPKGSSVILYRSREYIHHQFFSTPDWPGAIYATPTIQGSRPGCNIAMCWAALMMHGVDGYVKTTKEIITVARYLKKELSNIPGMFVYGDPIGPVVAVGSNDFNIYQVADTLSASGWHLQPLQKPPGIHIFLTALHTGPGVAQSLVKTIRQAATEAKMNKKEAAKGLAKLYGLASSVPDKNVVSDMAKIYLDVYYSTPEK